MLDLVINKIILPRCGSIAKVLSKTVYCTQDPKQYSFYCYSQFGLTALHNRKLPLFQYLCCILIIQSLHNFGKVVSLCIAETSSSYDRNLFLVHKYHLRNQCYIQNQTWKEDRLHVAVSKILLTHFQFIYTNNMKLLNQITEFMGILPNTLYLLLVLLPKATKTTSC